MFLNVLAFAYTIICLLSGPTHGLAVPLNNRRFPSLHTTQEHKGLPHTPRGQAPTSNYDIPVNQATAHYKSHPQRRVNSITRPALGPAEIERKIDKGLASVEVWEQRDQERALVSSFGPLPIKVRGVTNSVKVDQAISKKNFFGASSRGGNVLKFPENRVHLGQQLEKLRKQQIRPAPQYHKSPGIIRRPIPLRATEFGPPSLDWNGEVPPLGTAATIQ